MALCWAFFSKLCTIEELCLTPTVEQIRAIKEGIFTVSRIDGNETWLLANRFEVLSWIRSAEQK